MHIIDIFAVDYFERILIVIILQLSFSVIQEVTKLKGHTTANLEW